MKNRKLSELAREYGWRGANVFLFVLGLVLLAALEVWSAAYAWSSAPKSELWFGLPRAALIHCVVSAGFGLAAFLGMAVAGTLGMDERPHVRAKANSAWMVALCMMTVPVLNLNGAIDMDHRKAQWEAYVVSPAYEADRRIAMDENEESRIRLAASERLNPPVLADFNPIAFVQALALHALVALMAGAYRIPAPITQAEREAIERERQEALAEQKRKERNDLIRKLHKDGFAPAEIAARLQDLGYEGVTRPVIARIVAKKPAPKPAAKEAKKAANKPILAVFSGGK